MSATLPLLKFMKKGAELRLTKGQGRTEDFLAFCRGGVCLQMGRNAVKKRCKILFEGKQRRTSVHLQMLPMYGNSGNTNEKQGPGGEG